ncbi:MAG TPA: helix-turn-helix domain-containing protein [Clostridia bacterium]|nr:helix-turn-helix domain-containing protein [Clostridia bacterium]
MSQSRSRRTNQQNIGCVRFVFNYFLSQSKDNKVLKI